jgi:hypothetical protein
MKTKDLLFGGVIDFFKELYKRLWWFIPLVTIGTILALWYEGVL